MTFTSGVMYGNEARNYTAVDSSRIPAHPVNKETSVIKSNNYFKCEGQISGNSTISSISITANYYDTNA